jgi:hypothetical protein
MEIDIQQASCLAQHYIGTDLPLTTLGWGISGFVFMTPGIPSAVKVHRTRDGYTSELRVYRELKRLRLTSLHGLTIPRLRGFSDDARCIEMDFVSPPFLLDFAGVRFAPPDFPDDIMDNWHREISEKFGNNASIIYSVYNSLINYGIWYMDFRPSNINLKGLPGMLPDDPIDDAF